MANPIYIRQNGKWAKVSGKRGKWAVAKGWENQFAASGIQYWPTKDGAMIAANGWLDD